VAFRPPLPPDQVAVLPSQSEGTFIVVVTYEDETSLQRVRQQSPNAFIKTIGGQRYVQVASFQQVEYARFLAEELRQQGFNALISQS
jgi:cell division septation protein DedD